MRTIKASLILLAAACLTAFGCSSNSKAAPTYTTPTFSGTRAYTALTTQCDFGPRKPNSAARKACLAWLLTQFKAQTTNVVDQNFTFNGADNVAYTGDNIIARYSAAAGSTNTAPLMICAHWDTRPVADQDPVQANRDTPIDGANDGASGVAVLLELGRLFAATPPPRPIILACWDLEDMGSLDATAGEPFEGFCLGARYFAANMTTPKPTEAINLDMIGDSNLAIYREINSDQSNPEMMSAIMKAAAAAGYTQFVNKVGQGMTDDHVPLIEAGVEAVDLIDFDYPGPNDNSYWHTTKDTVDKCSAKSLTAVGQTLLNVIYGSTTAR